MNHVFYLNIRSGASAKNEGKSESFESCYTHILLKDQFIDFKVQLKYRNTDSSSGEIWKIYPLSEFEDYYVQKFLETSSGSAGAGGDGLFMKTIRDL